jgi:4-amino-4-deoxy-L-arabinose transferase-like glycosyltransferase
VRAAPVALALLAGVVYLVNLTVSGYANTYYSAAAQAAGQSVAAWFFGAIDAAGFITVDKPPVALWAMGLSVRLLGLSPFAILLPQAMAGVAAVVLLFDAVRRQFGPEAALIAGVTFAITPVAALMFRYNNPDAVLVLLLVAGAWAVVRGLETDRLRWPILAAVLVGVAFLTKYLQAYLVLPAFALTWLVAAPGGPGRRATGLAASAVAVALSSAWWVALIEVLPPDSRPFIGGSSTNSAFQLLLGYDGLGRIFGGGAGGGPGGFGGGGGGPGAGFGGEPGPLRMLNAQWAGQVGWLLPAAPAIFLGGLVARMRAPRTDARRAGYLLWGTWAAVHVLVFSLMSGIAHPYYAVALAPALSALFGAGVMELWRLRERRAWAGVVLGGVLVVTAWWGLQVLERTPRFYPGVGLGALFVALAASLVIAVPPVMGDARSGRIARGALVLGLAVALTGPALYTLATVQKPIAGGDPAAGPIDGAFGGRGAFGGFPGDAGGTSDALVAYLLKNRGQATWLVAVSSANQAGPIQLASGVPVMAMGGFMGSDPAPTLAQLQGYVRDGQLRYVLLGGRGGGPGGFFGGDGTGNVAGERSAWVTAACVPVQVPDTVATLYDCAGAAG